MSEEKRSSSSVASSDALEGFEVLAKTSSGKQITQIIKQVLKHPSIYVFGELLTLPSVLDLDKSEEYKPWLDLLRLFAYGTYNDYKTKSKLLKLPDLSPAELIKLKYLTIVSLAATHKILHYKLLMQELDINSIRETEDLIIDTINNGLIEGALDQRQQCFHVKFAIGRDLGPTDVDDMIKIIESWLNASTSVIKVLEKGINDSHSIDEKKKKQDAELEFERKSQIEALKIQKEDGGGDGDGKKKRKGGRQMGVAGLGNLFSRK